MMMPTSMLDALPSSHGDSVCASRKRLFLVMLNFVLLDAISASRWRAPFSFQRPGWMTPRQSSHSQLPGALVRAGSSFRWAEEPEKGGDLRDYRVVTVLKCEPMNDTDSNSTDDQLAPLKYSSYLIPQTEDDNDNQPMNATTIREFKGPDCISQSDVAVYEALGWMSDFVVIQLTVMQSMIPSHILEALVDGFRRKEEGANLFIVLQPPASHTSEQVETWRSQLVLKCSTVEPKPVNVFEISTNAQAQQALTVNHLNALLSEQGQTSTLNRILQDLDIYVAGFPVLLEQVHSSLLVARGEKSSVQILKRESVTSTIEINQPILRLALEDEVTVVESAPEEIVNFALEDEVTVVESAPEEIVNFALEDEVTVADSAPEETYPSLVAANEEKAVMSSVPPPSSCVNVDAEGGVAPTDVATEKKAALSSVHLPPDTGSEGGDESTAVVGGVKKEKSYPAWSSEEQDALESNIVTWANSQMQSLQTQLEEDLLVPNDDTADNTFDFGTPANTLLDEFFIRQKQLLSTEHRARLCQHVGTELCNLYQQHLQSLRNSYGQQYEHILDQQGIAEDTKNVEQQLNKAISVITEQFRLEAVRAIPCLAQPGGVFRDMDLEYVKVLQQLLQDIQSSTELWQLNHSADAIIHDDNDDDDDENNDRRVKKWYHKLGARALILAVNYFQGWLAWQGVQRAALERERQFPKFPIF